MWEKDDWKAELPTESQIWFSPDFHFHLGLREVEGEPQQFSVTANLTAIFSEDDDDDGEEFVIAFLRGVVIDLGCYSSPLHAESGEFMYDGTAYNNLFLGDYVASSELNEDLLFEIGEEFETRAIYIEMVNVHPQIASRSLGISFVHHTVSFLHRFLRADLATLAVLGAYNREGSNRAKYVVKYFENGGFEHFDNDGYPGHFLRSENVKEDCLENIQLSVRPRPTPAPVE